MKLQEEQILDAARTLFLEQGFQQITMRKIAKALNCSHGALYYYFKDKAELITQVIEHDFMLLKDLLQSISVNPHSPITALYQVLLTFIQFGIEHPEHYQLMFGKREPYFEIAQLKKSEDIFMILLAHVQASKRYLVDLPENQISWMIFMSTHGFISRSIFEQLDYPALESFSKNFVDMVIRGVKK